MGILIFVGVCCVGALWFFRGPCGAIIPIAIILFIALIWTCYYDFPVPKPNVIGTGTVQYDGKSATYFVVIDSAQYRINGIEQRSQPFLSEEMVVTVYTLPFEKGNKAIKGKKTVQDIVQFHIECTRSFYKYVWGSLLILYCIGIPVVVLHVRKIKKNDEWALHYNGWA